MAFEGAHHVTGDQLAMLVGRRYRADLGQQCRGVGGVQAHLGPTGMKVTQQDVEPVDPARVLGDEVLASLGEQAQDGGSVLGLDTVEAPVVQSDRCDRDRVGDVGLAGTA
jgi:hypothetical protein